MSRRVSMTDPPGWLNEGQAPGSRERYTWVVHEPRRDAIIEEYKKHVDVSLLRENLRRSPEERVLAMISMLELSQQLGRALKQQRSRSAR